MRRGWVAAGPDGALRWSPQKLDGEDILAAYVGSDVGHEPAARLPRISSPSYRTRNLSRSHRGQGDAALDQPIRHRLNLARHRGVGPDLVRAGASTPGVRTLTVIDDLPMSRPATRSTTTSIRSPP